MERLSRVLGQATEAHRRETGRALPTLWIYADNDRHFGPRHARQWLLAFRRVGGQAALHQLPPWQDDGNRLFADGLARWQPLLDAFLDALPVPAPQVVSRAEPGAGLPGP